MLVKELVKKYNFHDSCVNKLVYKNELVIVDIDLCMWKQLGYQDGTPEFKKIVLKFIDPQNYMWDSEKKEDEIDYDSIVDFSYVDNNVRIVLEDDDVSVLSFECIEVKIE